jgi:hypothetical protein
VREKITTEQCTNTHEEIEDMTHAPYASVVGILMYAMVYTQPKISHVVGLLSIYMSTMGKEHWMIVKRILRYLYGTKYYSICYQWNPETNREVNAHGFVDVK